MIESLLERIPAELLQIQPSELTLIQCPFRGLTLLSRHSVGIYQRNELTRNSSGNAHPQLFQLAEPLWIGPGLKSGVGEIELTCT